MPRAQRGASALPTTPSRDNALYSSWLADSYIDPGEIEQAAEVVKSSLVVMATSHRSAPASDSSLWQCASPSTGRYPWRGSC